MKRSTPFVLSLLLLSSGCSGVVPEPELGTQTLGVTSPGAADAEVPARDHPRSAVMVSDDELWRRLEAGGKTATVGLKAPGARRGVWRGATLILPEEVKQARQAVLAQPGVTLRSEDDRLPRLEVELADREAMVRLRRLPFVDYIEPARFQVTVFSGCENNEQGGTIYNIASNVDIVPWNYGRIDVQRAWGRGATGQGVTVGIVDTGLYQEQSQLWDPGFSGKGPYRDHQYFANYPEDYFDTCNHGTRMAGVIAAPRDDINIVGVAYGSNLRVSRAIADVYTGGGIFSAPVGPLINGIRNVADSGARIIAMAWGQEEPTEAIADEIRFHYYNKDVLFIGAAGTTLCPWWGIFPAQMDEVVSVTGLKDDNTLHGDACGYSTVDIGAVIGNAPTTGRRGYHVVGFGGSSNATALVSGGAALVWSKYPGFNRDQVRERLYSSTGRNGKDTMSGTGWGRVNAYRAVGGFYALGVSASNQKPEPGDSVTFTARPKGEGPFIYQWSTGATGSQLVQTCNGNGSSLNVSVTVWDTTDWTVMTASTSVPCAWLPPDPCELDPSQCEDPCNTQPWLCEDPCVTRPWTCGPLEM